MVDNDNDDANKSRHHSTPQTSTSTQQLIQWQLFFTILAPYIIICIELTRVIQELLAITSLELQLTRG